MFLKINDDDDDDVNIQYEMPLFAISMMIMHLRFCENWSGKSGNFVVASE